MQRLCLVRRWHGDVLFSPGMEEQSAARAMQGGVRLSRGKEQYCRAQAGQSRDRRRLSSERFSTGIVPNGSALAMLRTVMQRRSRVGLSKVRHRHRKGNGMRGTMQVNPQPGDMVLWKCPECGMNFRRIWLSFANTPISSPHCSRHGYPWVEMIPQAVVKLKQAS